MSQTENPFPKSDEENPLALRNILRYPFRRWLDVNPELVERVKSMPEDPNETGLDRLKATWQSYIQGENAIEFNIVTNAVGMAGMMGFVFGGIANSRSSMQDYIRQHNANIFHGKYRANRHIADTMYIEFFRRGLRQGLKYALFSGLFVGTLSMSTTYRNDIAFTDCALSGALAGSVWKAQLGPRAVLVNAIVGSIFGLTFAGIMKLSLKLCDTSIREMRYYHKAVIEDTSSVQLTLK